MECQPSICQKPCQKLENSGKLGETGRNLARNWMKHLNLACSSPFSQITGLFENLQIYWEKIVLWSFLGPWSLFAKFQIFGTWSLFQNRDLLFFSSDVFPYRQTAAPVFKQKSDSYFFIFIFTNIVISFDWSQNTTQISC